MNVRNKFTLRWEHSDGQHTKLSLIDPVGLNCGTLTIRTADLGLLAHGEWKGDIDWQDCPQKFIPEACA